MTAMGIATENDYLVRLAGRDIAYQGTVSSVISHVQECFGRYLLAVKNSKITN